MLRLLCWLLGHRWYETAWGADTAFGLAGDTWEIVREYRRSYLCDRCGAAREEKTR